MHDDVSSIWFFDWTDKDDRVLGVSRTAGVEAIFGSTTGYIFGLWFFALYVIVKNKKEVALPDVGG